MTPDPELSHVNFDEIEDDKLHAESYEVEVDDD